MPPPPESDIIEEFYETLLLDLSKLYWTTTRIAAAGRAHLLNEQCVKALLKKKDVGITNELVEEFADISLAALNHVKWVERQLLQSLPSTEPLVCSENVIEKLSK